jgi:hypothetical protein
LRWWKVNWQVHVWSNTYSTVLDAEHWTCYKPKIPIYLCFYEDSSIALICTSKNCGEVWASGFIWLLSVAVEPCNKIWRARNRCI